MGELLEALVRLLERTFAFFTLGDAPGLSPFPVDLAILIREGTTWTIHSRPRTYPLSTALAFKYSLIHGFNRVGYIVGPYLVEVMTFDVIRRLREIVECLPSASVYRSPSNWVTILFGKFSASVR